jgi:hypothetical protein
MNSAFSNKRIKLALSKVIMMLAGEFWARDTSSIYMKLLMNVPSKCS